MHFHVMLTMHEFADTVQPADVGVKEETADDDRGHGFFGTNQLNRVARWAQPITYVDIHECDSFTVSFDVTFTQLVTEPTCDYLSDRKKHVIILLLSTHFEVEFTLRIKHSFGPDVHILLSYFFNYSSS